MNGEGCIKSPTRETHINRSGGEMDFMSRMTYNHSIDLVGSTKIIRKQQSLLGVVLNDLPPLLIYNLMIVKLNLLSFILYTMAEYNTFGSVGWATMSKYVRAVGIRITFTQPKS